MIAASTQRCIRLKATMAGGRTALSGKGFKQHQCCSHGAGPPRVAFMLSTVLVSSADAILPSSVVACITRLATCCAACGLQLCVPSTGRSGMPALDEIQAHPAVRRSSHWNRLCSSALA